MRLLLALLVLLASPLFSADGGFVPVWTKGQTWYVHSRPVALSLHGGRPEEADHMGPGVTWEYQVASVKDAGSLRYYQVVVRDAARKDPRRAGLIFLAEIGPGGQPASLALAKATFESPLRGKPKRHTRDYTKEAGGPHPIVSEDSLVPADFPFFSAKAMAPSAVTTFDVTDFAGGLAFARDVTQRVKLASPKEESYPFRGPAEPIALKAGGDRSRDLDVTLERPTDGARVHQIWNPDLPWALYTRSHRGISYLTPAPAGNKGQR